MDSKESIMTCSLINVPPISKTLHIMKIPRIDGRICFAAKYKTDDIARIVKDIASKDTSRIVFYPGVTDKFLSEYDLSSTDVLRILRGGLLKETIVSANKTEMRIQIELSFRNSSSFVLVAWIDLHDNIHLSDINILKGDIL